MNLRKAAMGGCNMMVDTFGDSYGPVRPKSSKDSSPLTPLRSDVDLVQASGRGVPCRLPGLGFLRM